MAIASSSAAVSLTTALLLHQLEPWLQLAYNHIDLVQDVFLQPRDVRRDLWVLWHVHDEPAFSIKEVEAIELLELFARVDHAIAWREIFRMAEHEPYLPLLLEASVVEPVLPRFALMTLDDLTPVSTLFPEVARWLLSPIDDANHSPEFLTTRALLLECLVHKNGGVPFQRGALDRIQLKLHFRTFDAGARVLRELLQLAPFVQDPERARLFLSNCPIAKSSTVFQLHTVAPRGHRGVTDTSLTRLHAMTVHWGLHVDCAYLSRDSGASPRLMMEYLHDVIVTDRPNNPTMMSLGFDRSPRTFQATCSAVMLSRNLRSVNFTPPVEDAAHPLAWAWLAYALFSREASHSIEEVGLEASALTAEDALAFEAVLHANDPLAVVLTDPEGPFALPSQERTTREPAVVELIPNAQMLVRSTGIGGQVMSILTGHTVETLRVVDEPRDSQYVCVVYPGLGAVWVHRSHTIERRVARLPRASREQSIRRLKLNIENHTCMDSIVRLLALIGHSLESLALHAFDLPAPVDDDELQSVLASCPSLRRLDLVNIEVSDLKWVTTSGLTSVYLESVTTDRVPSVYPDGTESHDETHLESLLSDLESHGRSLRELHIQHSPQVLGKLEASIARMLERNRTLERFVLSVDESTVGLVVPPGVANVVKKHHGDALHAPLPLQSKLAFLSAICTASANQRVSLRANNKRRRGLAVLTVQIAGVIFGFAAESKHRVSGTVPFVDSEWL